MKKEGSINNIKKTLSVAWTLNRFAVIWILIASFLSAITPYIPIFLSPYILDKLSTSTDYWVLTKVAFLGLLCVFMVKVICDYINFIKNKHVTVCVDRFYMKKADKTLLMDYNLLDSSFTNDIRNRINIDNRES